MRTVKRAAAVLGSAVFLMGMVTANAQASVAPAGSNPCLWPTYENNSSGVYIGGEAGGAPLRDAPASACAATDTQDGTLAYQETFYAWCRYVNPVGGGTWILGRVQGAAADDLQWVYNPDLLYVQGVINYC